MKTFNDLGVEKNIIDAVEELGFNFPMPVQEEVIPKLLDENTKDIIALAQTGTGKTAAFGIPLIQKTETNKKHIQHLVLSPTRELCLQIADDIRDFAKYNNNIKITAVFGGSSIENQIRNLKKGVHIIVATPGRLMDFINRGVVNLSKINSVVLDEADEMLNMGFRDELDAIIDTTPKTRNTLLFSATMSKEVKLISERYLSNPLEITIGEKNRGAKNVSHQVYFVHAKERYLALKRIVDFYPDIYGIIFCRTRRETQEVAEKLIKDGYNADSLHGDLSQAQRTATMNKFRIKHIKLLIATDVAARGLDVDDLTHVINYNLPDELEIYTHRSGRTGRAGKLGTSIVIANLKEKNKIALIEKQLGKKFDDSVVPTGKEVCEKQLFHLIDRMEKVTVDHTQIDSFLPQIMKKLEWLDREELIKKFVSLEFNRFLDYYKDLADLTKPKKGKKGKDRSDAGMTRFFINLGRKDNIKPTTIIGLVKDNSGFRDIEIGTIDIMQNFSFFEAESDFEDALIKNANGQEYKNRKIVLEVASEKRGDSNKKENRKRSKDRRVRKSNFSSASNLRKKRRRR